MPYKEIKVLLFEDDPEYILLMSTFLSEPGEFPWRCRISRAETLAEGLKTLEGGGIDVALLDLMLPDSRGLETLAAVLERFPHVPVVVLTGLYDEGLALEAVMRGAQDYLVKATFDAKLLKRAIVYAIERSRLRWDMENILANAADAMLVVDGENKVRYANPAAETLFGRKRAELIGQPFRYPVEAQKTSELKIPYEGGEKTAEMRVTRLQWAQTEAFLASIRDITALRRIEQIKAEIKERRRVDRLKDQLMSTVSHELRSPLTVIKAAVANLMEGFVGPMPEPQMKLISLAHRNIERLARIINNLLDLSRLESERVHIRREKLELGGLIRDAVQGFELAGTERGISVEVDVPGDLPPVMADGDLIMQVLNNLLDNALRFARGKVRVSACAVDSLTSRVPRPGQGQGTAVAERKGVRVSVFDDGKGIPPSEIGDLFNKFVQVGRPAGGGGYKGTGLGLAICKEIVQRHNGSIWAESQLGQGTAFHLALPQE